MEWNGICSQAATLCRHYKKKRNEMKNNMKISITLGTLFNTNEGIKNVLKFIKNTRICTRRWILGTVGDEEVHEGG